MRVPASMIFLGGIALVCLGAGTGLVIVSSVSRHVLVRDDYYRDGLKLDAYRAREAAFDSLGISLTLHENRGTLVVEASKQATGEVAAGEAAVRERLGALMLTLQLRRPDDGNLDRDVAMTRSPGDSLDWSAAADPLRHGRWNARAVFSDAKGNSVLEEGFAYDAP
jgi:hypothetical protein